MTDLKPCPFWDGAKEMRETADSLTEAIKFIGCLDHKPAIGKHSAIHRVTLKRVFELAKELCPEAADVICWSLWHQILDCQRIAFLLDENDKNTRAPQWQPIETYDPAKHCETVDLYGYIDYDLTEMRITDCYLKNGEWQGWIGGDDVSLMVKYNFTPTHWMPLPAPPMESEAAHD